MNAPIVDEIRRIRETHAARSNYDLDEIFRDVKEQEQKSGLVFINGVARLPIPPRAPLPPDAATPVSET